MYTFLTRFFLTLIAISPLSLMAAEVTCSPELVSQFSCNQCFDDGSLYEGRDSLRLFDIAQNNGSLQERFFESDHTSNVVFVHNRNSSVTYQMPEYEFASSFFDNCGGLWCTVAPGNPVGNFTFLNPGESKRWLQTRDRFGLSVSSIDKASLTTAQRQSIRQNNFTITYTLRAFSFNTATNQYVGGMKTHVECQNIGVRFCWDGLTDSGDGETCDDGINNGQPGRCNSTCTGNMPDTRFDLALFKFVNSNPADTAATAERIVAGSTFQYMFQVDNRWPAIATGTTTVRDTSIPSDVTLTAVPSGTGWSCRFITGGFECTRADVLPAGSRFPDIVAPARLSPTATAGQTLTNTARVLNVGQIDDATNGGNNTNPANIVTDSVPPSPTCNSIVVTPTIVRVPGGVSVTCNTSNVPSTSQVRIDCGNGTSVNWSAGTCNYTVADPNPTARCTIVAADSSVITSPACAAVVDTRPQSACQSLIATPSSSAAGNLTSTLTCTAVNPDSTAVYALDCGDGSGFSTPSTSRSRSCTYGVGNFTARCQVRNAPGGAILGEVSVGACSAAVAVTNPPPPTAFELSLKKFVGTGASIIDAQDAASAVTVTRGVNYNYTIRVTNLGPNSVTGTTTVVDTLPTGVTLVGVTGGFWTCSLSGNGFSCSNPFLAPSGATFSDLIVTANIPTTSADGVYLNTATVSNPNERVSPDDNSDPANVRVGSVLTPACTSLVASPSSSNGGSLVSTLTCSGSNLPPASTFSIACGNGASIIGPTGTCSYGVGNFTASCTINGALTSAACQAGIAVSTGGGGGGTPKCIKATVVIPGNPSSRARTVSVNEPNRDIDVVCEGENVGDTPWSAIVYCGNGGEPVPASLNSSYQTTPGGATGGGAVALTARCNYPNAGTYEVSCEFRNQVTTSPLCGASVTKSGGGGGCISNCGGGGGSNPRCGDGVVQRPNPQGVFEECDDANSNNNDACTNTCRVRTSDLDCASPFGCVSTNPGTDGTITPFTLRRTSSSSFVTPTDGSVSTNPGAGEINLFNYRTIIGQSVPVFATNDTIKFRPTTATATRPLVLPEGSSYCIGNNPEVAFTGSPITGAALCRTLSEAHVFPATAKVHVPVWKLYPVGTPPSVRFLPRIEKYVACGRESTDSVCRAENIQFVNEIDLFRGSDLQWFRGKDLSTTTGVRFDPAGKYAYTNYLQMNSAGNASQYVYRSPSTSEYPRFSVTMRFLEQPIAVRVAKSAVANSAGGNAYVGSSAGADLSKVAENFLPIVAKNWNANATSANIANAISSTTRNTTNTLTGAMTLEGIIPNSVRRTAPLNRTVASLTDFNTLTQLPSNGNILVASGLTIDDTSSANALTLDGVRTVVVFGNLTIKSDLLNSANSSWAFIVQGNIEIDPSVSRLAGVYVAIPSGSTGGQIQGSASTIRQLLVDGTLYGKLSDIITDRTYVFANNYSQIVSAGTVINYSNRALLLPPPLLVNLLKQYTFDRK